MIDPKKQSEMDQAIALLLETLPPMLYNFYLKLQKEGFSKSEAFYLVRDCARSIFGGEK